VGALLLETITALARDKGLGVLMLETGEAPGFEGAWRLYERAGFVKRGAFLDYPDSGWSRFYEKQIGHEALA
jgi:putative acetyltransferase